MPQEQVVVVKPRKSLSADSFSTVVVVGNSVDRTIEHAKAAGMMRDTEPLFFFAGPERDCSVWVSRLVFRSRTEVATNVARVAFSTVTITVGIQLISLGLVAEMIMKLLQAELVLGLRKQSALRQDRTV